MVQCLDLGSNKLSGPIPSSIHSLNSTLSALSLNDNQLSGTLPEEIFRLSSLQSLNQTQNRLSGSISSSIICLFASRSFLLSQASMISLNQNKFYGSLPTSIGAMKYLRVMNIQSNDLTGTLPMELYKLHLTYRDILCPEPSHRYC